MNVERFTIPEILFRPSMIGIDQAGIAESIYNSVEELPERMINKRKYFLLFYFDI
jgi:actin-related protein 6